MSELRIAAAAIRIGQMVYALPPPARHADVAYVLNNTGHRMVLRRCLHCIHRVAHEQHTEDRAQGFVTTQGLFVNRHQAHRIAFHAGQTTWAPSDGSQLTSEDVW